MEAIIAQRLRKDLPHLRRASPADSESQGAYRIPAEAGRRALG